MDKATLHFFLVWLGATLQCGVLLRTGDRDTLTIPITKAWLLLSAILWVLRLGGYFVG